MRYSTSCGASEDETQAATVEIINLAVNEKRCHCRRSPTQFIEDTMRCCHSLQEIIPDGFGVRADVEFYEGEDEYLGCIEAVDERHYVYMLMVCAKLAERKGEKHFPWPSAKVVAYMNQGCGREFNGYGCFRYLTTKKYNPESSRHSGGLSLVDRIAPIGRKATQYRRGKDDLQTGDRIRQTEIELKHGLLPLTDELWKQLDSPRTGFANANKRHSETAKAFGFQYSSRKTQMQGSGKYR